MSVYENDPVIVLSLYALAVAVGVVLILKFSKDKTRKISTLRLFIQIAATIAIFMGLIIGPFNVPLFAPLGPTPRDHLIGANILGNQFPDGISIPVLACYYPNGRTVTCPIWQLQAYIYPFWDYPRGYEVIYSTTGLEKLAVVVGMVAAASIVLGRFFCGWLCPFGLYQDLLTRIRKATKRKHLSFSDSTSAKLGQSRYIIIAVFLILSVIFASYAIFGTELIPDTRPGGPEGTEAGITSWINEPFCLVCPMRPLCILFESGIGAMNWNYVSQIAYGPFWIGGMYVTSINLAILIAVTILALAYRRLWCRICPLGALTALFSSFTPFKQIALTKLEKNESKCTKCGVCKRVCPTQATAMFEQKGGDVTESRCMLCARCVEVCPYPDALKMSFAGKTLAKSRNWLEEGYSKQPDT
ncbi:MAG: 4Fe-4S binding protein [Candidatus Bathyarchaeota archaeon]|nr:4Fe-4S binding protein [Candidatus Bathyarchaeota archaeon]